MNIINVLEEKLKELRFRGDPLLVSFLPEEITVLSDESQLISLKLQINFPEEFDQSKDLFDCSCRLLKNPNCSLYQVLEFCMLKNRAIEDAVVTVFSQLRR